MRDQKLHINKNKKKRVPHVINQYHPWIFVVTKTYLSLCFSQLMLQWEIISFITFSLALHNWCDVQWLTFGANLINNDIWHFNSIVTYSKQEKKKLFSFKYTCRYYRAIYVIYIRKESMNATNTCKYFHFYLSHK
jgi:hypothetical protein